MLPHRLDCPEDCRGDGEVAPGALWGGFAPVVCISHLDSGVTEVTCNLAVPDSRKVGFYYAVRELRLVEVCNKQQKQVLCG